MGEKKQNLKQGDEKLILSEKDIRVATEWYEGRLFRHPTTRKMVRFLNLPEEERQRLQTKRIERNFKECKEDYESIS